MGPLLVRHLQLPQSPTGILSDKLSLPPRNLLINLILINLLTNVRITCNHKNIIVPRQSKYQLTSTKIRYPIHAALCYIWAKSFVNYVLIFNISQTSDFKTSPSISYFDINYDTCTQKDLPAFDHCNSNLQLRSQQHTLYLYNKIIEIIN